MVELSKEAALAALTAARGEKRRRAFIEQLKRFEDDESLSDYTRRESRRLREEVEEGARATWVYFFRPEGCESVKIGYASCVDSRLSAAQVWSPVPVRRLGVIRGTKADEKALHERLKEHHVRGEWFRITDEHVASLIAEVGDDDGE